MVSHSDQRYNLTASVALKYVTKVVWVTPSTVLYVTGENISVCFLAVHMSHRRFLSAHPAELRCIDAV